MGSGIAEVDDDPIAHQISEETIKPLNNVKASIVVIN
jgi:hypothetical protein